MLLLQCLNGAKSVNPSVTEGIVRSCCSDIPGTVQQATFYQSCIGIVLPREFPVCLVALCGNTCNTGTCCACSASNLESVILGNRHLILPIRRDIRFDSAIGCGAMAACIINDLMRIEVGHSDYIFSLLESACDVSPLTACTISAIYALIIVR